MGGNFSHVTALVSSSKIRSKDLESMNQKADIELNNDHFNGPFKKKNSVNKGNSALSVNKVSPAMLDSVKVSEKNSLEPFISKYVELRPKSRDTSGP